MMVYTDLKNIIDGLGSGIIELNEKLAIKYCNKIWFETSDYSFDELANRSISDFLTIGSISNLNSIVLSQTKSSTSATLWFKNKGESIVPYNCQISKSEDNSSWLIQVHVKSNVSENNRKISDLYYEVDNQGLIKIISADTEDKLHYLSGECLFKPHTFLYKDPEKRSQIIHQIITDSEISNHHDVLVSKKGEEINVIESIEKISDEHGQYLGFSCTSKFYRIEDSEFKLHEEYKDRYIKYWGLTNEGLLLHKGGLIIDANSRVEKMIGYSREELIGKYMIDEVVKEEWKETVLSKIVNEDTSPYEIECIRRNGEVFPVEIESRNFLYNGEVVRITAIRDLSDKRSEGKLADKEKIIDFFQNNSDRKIGQEYFESVVLQISKLLKADQVFIGRIDESKENIKTLATCFSGIIGQNIVYALKDTPCEQVYRKRLCCYPDKVDKFFPKDMYLSENEMKGYIGIELQNSEGEAIGILVAMFKRKIINDDFAKTVFNIFSHNIEAELERILIEEELKKSTNMLQLILDNIPVNVYWKDKYLQYLGGNKSFINDAGVENMDALKGKTDFDMPWSEEADLYSVSDKSVLKTGRPRLNEEEPQSSRNGSLRWVRTSKVPMRNKNNQIIGLLGINEDITEKKFIESSIVESETRFRNLAENIPGVIYSCQFDTNFSFIYLNENIKNLTGYSKSNFLEEQVSFKELIHPDDLNFMFEQKKMAVNNRAAYQIQYRVKHKDQGWKWVDESGIGVYEDDELLHLEGVMMDVTSRVQSENLVKNSEIKFRLLIENLTGVFWVTDLKSKKIEYISPQYELIWERSISNMYKDSSDFLNMIHPDDKDRVLIKFRQMEEGEPFEDIYRIVCENNKEKTIWVTSSLYIDEKEGMNKIVGYAEDITEKTNIERTLRESEIKFKTLIENLDGVTYILDTKTKKIEYVSPQYEAIWGHKCEDLLKDTSDFMKNIHPDDLPVIFENISKVDHGNSIKQEFRINVNGKEKFIAGKVSQLSEEFSAGSSKVLGYSEDVTDSELAKREVEKLALVSQKTNNAIIITDNEGKIEWINDAFINFSGYQLGDIKGQFIENYLYGPGTSEESITRIKIGIENRLKVSSEAIFKSTTGQKRWVDVSVNPVFDSKGKFEKLFAVLVDITDRKINEEAIKKQNQELLKTNQELDNFVYRVSHDLKAPISSVKGLIHIIKLEKSKPNIDDCIDRIEESMDKLDHFILDILDYSRNSRFEVEPKLVDIETEFENVFQELKYLDQSESITKNIKVEKNSDFYSDKRRVKFIINNLISNAIRFSDPQKNQKIDIVIKVDKKGCRIKCVDNGIGIEKEYLDRIFEMFFRATEVKAGSGLGLYIVKEAVDKLNGKIKVDSKKDKGSTFEIFLPNMISEITGD